MAVMMIMKWDGVSPDQYEQARKVVNWEGDWPKGAKFHVASFGEGALHVTDVWESAEDFQRFVDERLTPGVQQVGIQGQPDVQIYPMHATFNPGIAKL
jgi:hypothetical protein